MNDIRQAIEKHTSALSQPGGTWKLLGPDLDGDELTVVACLDDAVVVVTIF